MKSWIAAYVLLVVIILGDPPSAPSQIFSTGVQKFKVAVDAQDFTLADIEGRKITLSDFKGRVVILNFFTTD